MGKSNHFLKYTVCQLFIQIIPTVDGFSICNIKAAKNQIGQHGVFKRETEVLNSYQKEKAYCLFRMSLRVLLYFPMLLDLQPQNVTKKHFKIVGNIVKHIKRHHNYLHSQKDFICIYILICYSTDKLIIGIKMYGITSHVSQ